MTARLRFFTLLCVLSLPNLLRAQGVTTARSTRFWAGQAKKRATFTG
jgi:hypothetical protein